MSYLGATLSVVQFAPFALNLNLSDLKNASANGGVALIISNLVLIFTLDQERVIYPFHDSALCGAF